MSDSILDSKLATKLPPLPAYPPQNIQSNLPPAEWQACLEGWIVSIEVRLRLTDKDFETISQADVGTTFLISYLQQHTGPGEEVIGSKDAKLRHRCYSLLKRIVSTAVLQMAHGPFFDLLGMGSMAFSKSKDWRSALSTRWQLDQKELRKVLKAEKALLVSGKHLGNDAVLRQKKMAAFVRCLPDAAAVMMAGADYLDTLIELYNHGSSDLSRAVTENCYYCLLGLLMRKQTTLLLDNLYHMKSTADQQKRTHAGHSTLLSSLLCTTSYLHHLRSNAELLKRQQTLVSELESYRQSMLHFHPSTKTSLRRSKGKSKQTQAGSDMHLHRASQISQVHELFPDLQTGYILKLLDHYSDSVENVIAALLEPTSLPAELQNREFPPAEPSWQPDVPNLVPHSTPPMTAQRHGVFDNDDFDRLNISSRQLRRGKKDISVDHIEDADQHAQSKAAIMAALAAFDADDDERDDTYDVADVGGAVDNTVDTDERQTNIDQHEGSLFAAWKSNPELFARDSKTRSSNIRQQLKRETGLSDEQIEGWAVMLRRDPKQHDRLEKKYSSARAFKSSQTALDSTKWNANTSTENSEVESGAEASGDGRRMGQAGIRGHRTFGRGRGRGGSTSGPADAPSTQQARRKKEQGKGRGGAQHNRRDGRAKKVGRGMGGPVD